MLKDLKIPSLISLPVNFCSVIMASRRSKDKTPATTSQIVKKELVSPLEIVNRYTPLGTIPRPNYSSVLTTPYEPYAMTTVNQPIKIVYPKASNASQYVKKQFVQNLFSIEPNRAPITDPFSLATSYFPPQFHWIPKHGEKTVQYYSNILRHENSITIKVITDKTNTTKIIYHSVFLNHLFLKKCGALTLLPQEDYQNLLFPIHIMIILLPGSDSCSTKMKICLIHGLLILIKISILNSPYGSSVGGPSLVQVLKYSLLP